MVQPEVKSNTWKDNTTCFWPLYWLSEISPSLTEGRVKSGAVSPTCAGIFLPFFDSVPRLVPPGRGTEEIIHHIKLSYDTRSHGIGEILVEVCDEGDGMLEPY